MQIKLEHSPMSYDEFTYAFPHVNKFLLLGSGYFADVFSNTDSAYVYKVAAIEHHPKTLRQALQDPYLAFLDTVKDTDNPFFPHVRTLTIFKHQVASFYVAEVEKLINIRESKLNQSSLDMFDNLEMMFENRHPEESQDWIDSARIYHEHKNIVFTQVFQTMAKLLKHYDNDLHAGNMMMRKNGQLVITDPLCPKGMKTPLNSEWPVRRNAQQFCKK